MRGSPVLLLVFFGAILLLRPLRAEDPRSVAELGVSAWNARDGAALAKVAHPELIARMRTSQALHNYVLMHPDFRATLTTGTDGEIGKLFCDALREIAPHPRGEKEPANHYLGTALKGSGAAVVTFDRPKKHGEDFTRDDMSIVVVVLKKVGETWKFLWLPSAQVHIDMTWDPTN